IPPDRVAGAAVDIQAPGQPPMAAPAGDALPEAIALARGAAEAGLPLKLLGGLAIRALSPDLPPRTRGGQDMDFACLSRKRKDVAAYLERSGCEPDRRFNNLNGDRQMYFTAPSGRPIDVIVDLLLSKLQIYELNEKDARDILQLLASVPLDSMPGAAGRSGQGPVVIDTDRFGKLLGADWGWWRTVTGNLAKLPQLAEARPELRFPGAPLDPLAQARA